MKAQPTPTHGKLWSCGAVFVEEPSSATDLSSLLVTASLTISQPLPPLLLEPTLGIHAMFLMNYVNNITNIVLKQNLIINRCTMSSSGDITWASEATQQKRSVKTLHRMGGSLAYGSNGQLFDIAIIEVNTPFNLTSSVVAAKLPTNRTSAKTNLVVSGWGTTAEGKGPMQYLLR